MLFLATISRRNSQYPVNMDYLDIGFNPSNSNSWYRAQLVCLRVQNLYRGENTQGWADHKLSTDRFLSLSKRASECTTETENQQRTGGHETENQQRTGGSETENQQRTRVPKTENQQRTGGPKTKYQQRTSEGAWNLEKKGLFFH